jgi:hypothetical protein
VVASDSGLKARAFRGARGFYAKAFSETERRFLKDAMGVEGLDQEIALLRVLLHDAVGKQPRDVELMFKGAALLARLVQTKFNLSKEDAGDLKVAITHAVTALSEMYPVSGNVDPIPGDEDPIRGDGSPPSDDEGPVSDDGDIAPPEFAKEAADA